MYPRFISPRALFRDAYRLVRRPSRVTIWAAAATAVAAVAVIVGVSTGQAPAGQADDLAAAAGHAGHAAPAHQPAHTGPAPSHQAPSKPYTMYDSVLPSALPTDQVVATYAAGGYAVSPAAMAGHKKVVWIDTTATDPQASVLDIEPGAATPDQAASWAWQRLHAHPNATARLYCNQSQWPAVQAAVASLPASMRSHIRWWIADPTGVPHLVPGSDATQWYWGSTYDLSTVTPRF